MIEQYLWIAGSIPFIILGIIHLAYTFFTDKFSVRDKQVENSMKTTYPVLTKATTMWRAWIGFNGSHSAGVIYIGIINFFAAILEKWLLSNPVFLTINIITVLFYLWLGRKYWFGVPFKGVLVSATCFIAAVIVFLFKL